MDVTIIEPADLTPIEADRLTKLETVISGGMRSFVEVGTALAVIRDEGLYRAGYRTFEAYVADKWGWSRANAYDYIAAAGVQDNVRPVVQLPTLRHARMLAAFSADQQRAMAPKIADLSVKDATKAVKQWRDIATNTDPVSTAARREIREALASEDGIPAYTRWVSATEALLPVMRELPGEELAGVAERLKALVDTYQSIRADRR